MIKIENTDIFGWEAAVRGARNPINSWEKSDSRFLRGIYIGENNELNGDWRDILNAKDCSISEPYSIDCPKVIIGPNDHKLLMNLCKGGTEEAKWRRMIHVQMDATAPLYWWKEFDTYKVGTVSNSCSTMHKIHAKEFTRDDFSCEHLWGCLPEDTPESEVDTDCWIEDPYGINDLVSGDVLNFTIAMLNKARDLFLQTKDKAYWWQLIQLLPSSYNQKRTIDLNYEVLASQYRQRKDHKLDEWHQYCDWIQSLPYSEFITMEK